MHCWPCSEAAAFSSGLFQVGPGTAKWILICDTNILNSSLLSLKQLSDAEDGVVQVTDLLYQKQSQLERVMAERAAQQMTWERELATARDSAERTQRSVRLESSMLSVHLHSEAVATLDAHFPEVGIQHAAPDPT